MLRELVEVDQVHCMSCGYKCDTVFVLDQSDPFCSEKCMVRYEGTTVSGSRVLQMAVSDFLQDCK